MILLTRISTIINPLLTLGALEYLIFKPDAWLGVLIFLVAVQIVTVLRMMRWKLNTKDAWVFLVLPVLLSVTAHGWMTLISSTWLIHVVAILTGLMIMLYFDHLFHFLFQRSEYQSYSLEHITRYMMLGTLFAGMTFVYASALYIPIDRWIVVVAGVVFLALMASVAIWFLKLDKSLANGLFVLLSVISVEVFWTLQLLPLHYYVNALLVTTAFYSVLNLGHYSAKQSLQPVVVKRYGIGLLILLVLVLATSEWL